ncbi:MAG: hypothetical protein R3F19_05545 [Verrucomicrobiales bacterium]
MRRREVRNDALAEAVVGAVKDGLRFRHEVEERKASGFGKPEPLAFFL